MKKIKKLLALIMAMAMVLGMSVTAFADSVTGTDSVDIPVNGAQNETTYQYLQLIQANPATDTGWEFSTPAIANNFKSALSVTDDQIAIWMLIKNQKPNNTNIPTNITGANENQVANAIKAVANAGYTLEDGKTVTKPGVYYIRANKPQYSYNPMAAYVSFGYNENGVASGLVTEGVNAKGEPITTGKTSDEENKVTEIGRTETYYVSSLVPFVPLGDSEREYWVKDTITGAEYVIGNDNKVTLSVYYGKSVDDVKKGELTADETFTAAVESTTNGQKFAADLSSILENNTHANSSIVITYQATVTDVTVGNDVTIGDGTNDSTFGNASEGLVTGKIKIVKKGEENPNPLLQGAGFIISKTVTNDDKTETTKYATFDTNNKFTGWVDTKEGATEVFTGADGTLTVSGLDEGTYHITEKTAPAGYSIRDGIEDVTLETNGSATVELEAVSEVLDTKLGALPSTGGIGTTIFTIGGCVIMIIAAGLFFASRRKSAK